jgi:hypothetical protein
MNNVLKASTKEFLDINETDYEYEVARQGLDIFLIDGKAVVKDEIILFILRLQNITTYAHCMSMYCMCYIR